MFAKMANASEGLLITIIQADFESSHMNTKMYCISLGIKNKHYSAWYNIKKKTKKKLTFTHMHSLWF